MITKASVLVYADSGTGKTTLLLSLLQYLRSTSGKGLRVVLKDFQEGETISPFIDAPDVSIVDVSQAAHPFEVLNFLAMGYWPDSKDRYVVYSGDDTKDRAIKLIPPTLATWEAVGGFGSDSLTGGANLMMKNMSSLAASGTTIGPDVAYRLTDGGLKIAGSGMAHYGLAQRRILDYVEKTKTMPVIRYFTALETKAEDKTVVGKSFVVGPEIAGKAATQHMTRSVGNMFNLVHENEKGKVGTRLYLRTWFDGSDPTPRLGKCSFPGAVYNGEPAYLTIQWPYPSDKPWGIGEYLVRLEEMQEKAKGVYGKARV